MIKVEIQDLLVPAGPSTVLAMQQGVTMAAIACWPGTYSQELARAELVG